MYDTDFIHDFLYEYAPTDTYDFLYGGRSTSSQEFKHMMEKLYQDSSAETLHLSPYLFLSKNHRDLVSEAIFKNYSNVTKVYIRLRGVPALNKSCWEFLAKLLNGLKNLTDLDLSHGSLYKLKRAQQLDLQHILQVLSEKKLKTINISHNLDTTSQRWTATPILYIIPALGFLVASIAKNDTYNKDAPSPESLSLLQWLGKTLPKSNIKKLSLNGNHIGASNKSQLLSLAMFKDLRELDLSRCKLDELAESMVWRYMRDVSYGLFIIACLSASIKFYDRKSAESFFLSLASLIILSEFLISKCIDIQYGENKPDWDTFCNQVIATYKELEELDLSDNNISNFTAPQLNMLLQTLNNNCQNFKVLRLGKNISSKEIMKFSEWKNNGFSIERDYTQNVVDETNVVRRVRLTNG